MALKQMPEGSDEVIWETEVLGKGTSKCKGPEAECAWYAQGLAKRERHGSRVTGVGRGIDEVRDTVEGPLIL